MASHVTDWFPGRVSRQYTENYDKIFKEDPCEGCCFDEGDTCGDPHMEGPCPPHSKSQAKRIAIQEAR